jgi:DNA-binding LacI/PurR family transcriptional regulator
MLDVAEAAGVSRTTASYVLNGQDAAIPAATRQRVLAAAEALGFRANRLAQHLAGQPSGLVGLIIPDIASPFFSGLVAALNPLARERRAHVLLELSPTGFDEYLWQRAVDRLLGWSVDGLMLWTWSRPGSAWAALPASLQRLPVALIGQEDPGDTPADCVFVDFQTGTRALMAHLVGLGHRRVAFVGYGRPATEGQALGPADVRGRAVAKAVAGIGPSPVMLEADTLESARRQVAALSRSDQAPTAVVCLNDMLALAAYRGLRDAGLRVPDDVSLASCDGSWAGRCLDPDLTRLEVPLTALAEGALELLYERIADQRADPRHIGLAPSFVAGASTGPAPTDRA